jgi:hypothetical protein
MFFRSKSECAELAEAYGLEADVKANTIDRSPPFPHDIALSFAGQRDRCYPLAGALTRWFGDFDPAVLWVTEYGIWPSSENLHLYYSLRQFLGDHRPISEAPGHIFVKHEQAELTTFLHILLEFGWGCLLFKYPQTSCVIISHDEWMQFLSECDLAEVAGEAKKFGLRQLGSGAD